MRDHILAEISRLAEANRGTPPGVQAFTTATGITMGKWRGVYWARWGDALAEAGFEANQLNRKYERDDLLRPIAGLAHKLNRMPSYADIRLHKRSDATLPNDKTIANHFGEVENFREALRGYARKLNDDALLSLIPASMGMPVPSTSTAPDGHIYLLKSGSHYKIGRTDNIARRITEIRVALPENVQLIHSIKTDDPVGIEAYWHKRFADVRKNGEWFALSANNVKAFLRRTFQ